MRNSKRSRSGFWFESPQFGTPLFSLFEHFFERIGFAGQSGLDPFVQFGG
jgi:hypothetical protein